MMPLEPGQQLHIAVCDDEPMDRQQAADLTCEIMAAEGLPCSLSGYESAADLLTAIRNGARFHILLLDVMMDGLNGMELAAWEARPVSKYRLGALQKRLMDYLSG